MPAVLLRLLPLAALANPFVIFPPSPSSRSSPSLSTTAPKFSSAVALSTSSDSSDHEDRNNTEEEKWEWDGIPIEGAHDAEFESFHGDDDENDTFIPSIGFMSMASSVASPALSAITSSGGDSLSSSSSPSTSSSSTSSSPSSFAEFDILNNAGNLHRRFIQHEEGASQWEEAMDADELMEMGGDPFFLDDDFGSDGGDGDTKNEVREESSGDDSDFFEWDGTVDEDAHLELD